jgi:hypothetical protein
MPGPASDPTTLTLHAVRLLGFAETVRVTSRFNLDHADVHESLLDFEAYGWVTRSAFAGGQGWSLTARGRVENERRLGEELDGLAARPIVAEIHDRFLPVNATLLEAATRWQVRPRPSDSMAANDHTDLRWDDGVIESLRSVGVRLSPLQTDLAAVLARFAGYGERFDAALARVARGENRWATGVGIDSCHVVWMQLHEDLLASLGLDRAGGH